MASTPLRCLLRVPALMYLHRLLLFCASLFNNGLVLLAGAPLHHGLASLRSVQGSGGASLSVPLAGLGVAWHCLPRLGCVRVFGAVWVCGTRQPLLLGTWSCVVVVAGGVPLSHASGPRVGAPRLVWYGRSRCFGRLLRGRGAFPQPDGARSQIYSAAAGSTWRPAENRAHGACRWPLPREGLLALSASYLFGARRWGYPWRVDLAYVSGCVRCGVFACVDPVTHASRFPYRP